MRLRSATAVVWYVSKSFKSVSKISGFEEARLVHSRGSEERSKSHKPESKRKRCLFICGTDVKDRDRDRHKCFRGRDRHTERERERERERETLPLASG